MRVELQLRDQGDEEIVALETNAQTTAAAFIPTEIAITTPTRAAYPVL